MKWSEITINIHLEPWLIMFYTGGRIVTTEPIYFIYYKGNLVVEGIGGKAA